MKIRFAHPQDLDAVAAVEAACFPTEEAAGVEAFRWRLETFPGSFLVAEAEDGEIIGIVNGAVTDQKTITDDLFEAGGGHNPRGAYQSVFGLAVLPRFQGQGTGAALMQAFIDLARAQGRRGIILTCKAQKIPYYSRFGYVNLGISDSVHGGATWYDMIIDFQADKRMKLQVTPYADQDIPEMIAIWNEVVADGVAFPQMEALTEDSGRIFFAEQSHCGVAKDTETGETVGLYILHPNNVGRCGHLCNASYAVKKGLRGQHIGETLVTDCLIQAKNIGFKILQFNAVVKTNTPALKLYAKLGFTPLGEIPGGFLMKDGHYESIIPHYKVL